MLEAWTRKSCPARQAPSGPSGPGNGIKAAKPSGLTAVAPQREIVPMPLKMPFFPIRMGFAAGLGGLALCGVVLSACSSDEDMAAQYVERPIEQIYGAGWLMIDRQNWTEAGRQFDEVERQHPYSVWARRAILMSAYCYYQGNRYDESIEASTRFIQLHPGNKDVPYAYYLKAVSLYEQIGDVERDQGKTEEALTALQDLIQRFPDSEYARDARLKVDLTRDHLAGREMSLGRFDLRRRSARSSP